MKKIFCIIGKSSSGKDTVYKIIRTKIPELLPVIIYTTRPMRDGEIDGETYYFISMDEMNSLDKNSKLIERRDYHTVNGLWSYATSVDCFHEDKDYIIITTPEAYGKFKEKLKDFELIPIYIEVNDYTRLLRSLEREKQNKEKNYEEVCRRFLSDAKDFDKKILDELNITNKFNNDKDCFKEVESFIRFKMSQSNQKVGNWIAFTNCSNEGIYCSNCNKKIFKFQYANQIIDSNYCPNCGIKMMKGIKKI